jgi:hypothetical protein
VDIKGLRIKINKRSLNTKNENQTNAHDSAMYLYVNIYLSFSHSNHEWAIE